MSASCAPLPWQVGHITSLVYDIVCVRPRGSSVRAKMRRHTVLLYSGYNFRFVDDYEFKRSF